ncbi:hypothetical protein SAMN05421830_113103 [Desulfomicrobium norvegicum]|uniref:Methyltransferase domain-containing protein n=1 Tax=Desulfomicrobium norvegicum (strain DSM 1741 / NCIMB 8310) TaxID=52561 RepID=A0A8G2C5Z8_DESNO|nr:methyltransferase domain-containing protein [Desulfomicrobium norvegicum]SFM08074.1 hypothetical protein SAMN05421830_113103 [Desulfomicrobium norvegicum]
MRNTPYTSIIDCSKRILEIGPLANPLIPKANGPFIFYADIRSTEDIKQFYANDPNVDCSAIEDVDFVIIDTYEESLKKNKIDKFDYVLGSHVIEHIPLLLRFFLDISTVLKDNGKLCLSIPDHRYCFDHFRTPTSFSEAYDVYLHGANRLAPRILDFFMNTSHNNPSKYWNTKNDTENVALLLNKTFEEAKKNYERALSGEYIDVHFSVFTTFSFLHILFDTIRANMLPFRVEGVFPTLPNTFEFHVILSKHNAMLHNERIRHRELQKIIVIMNRIMHFEAKARASISPCD